MAYSITYNPVTSSLVLPGYSIYNTFITKEEHNHDGFTLL